VITLRGADAPISALKIGTVSLQADKKEYTALRDGQNTIFLIRDFLLTRLNKNAKDFLPRPTPAPNASPEAAAEGEEDEGDNAEMMRMLQQQMGNQPE